MALDTNIANVYTFDASDGTDSVGGKTLANSSVTFGTGKLGAKCATFNGSAKFETSVNIGITGTTARTMNFWVKYTSTSGDGMVTFGTTGTGNGFSALAVSNQLYFGGESADVGPSGAALNDGNWHMCTITYDGTTIRLYTDGTAGSTGTPTLNTAAAHLFVGERNDGSSKFTGDIDEVYLWTRALSAAEVTSLYNGGAGLQYPFTTSINSGFLMFM